MADEKKVSGKTRAGGAAKPFPWEEAIAEQYERTKSRLKGLATEPEAELQRILEQYLPRKSDSREERLQKLEDLAMGFAGTTKLPTPKLARASGLIGTPEQRMLEQGYDTGWYHGTTGDIKEFKPDLLGEATGAASAKQGFFFARDPIAPPKEMTRKSNDPDTIAFLKRLGKSDAEIEAMNTVSMKGHGADQASGYAQIGGSREYREAMRKAAAAEKNKNWSEYEKQMQIAEELETKRMNQAQSLVAKHGDARDTMLAKIQDAWYNKPMSQSEAEASDAAFKKLMGYGWYNNPAQLETVKKELINKLGKDKAADVVNAIDKYKSVTAERLALDVQSGANVLPIALRYKNPMVYDFKGSTYRDQTYADLVAQAKAGGHDALIMRNTFDPGAGTAKLIDVGVVFDPSQIRSKFAQFDPAKMGSADILAAGVPLGLIGSTQLDLPKKQEKKPAPQVKKAEGGLAQYGLRHSGEGVKGKGYFGLLPNKMDGVSTEISVEDETGEYPLIVPTLTAEELDRLLAGGEPTLEMLDKASSWAATRRKRGQSPFASPTEVRMPRPKAEGGSVSLTDLPDEVNPSNWREHLQNNVRADAQALLGVKDGGAIDLNDLIEQALKKKDGGAIDLNDLIEWTLAKKEHRKMKEGGAVKMQGGGQTFPLQRPEEVTDLKPRPRTKRDELLEMLSKGVGSVHEFMAKPFGYENPPGEMVSSLIGLPGTAKTLERMAYGDPLTSGAGMTTNLLPETTEAAFLGLGAAPTALKLTKNLPVGLSIKPTDMLDMELASKMKAEKIKAPANPVGFYNPAEKAALNLQRKKGPGSAFISDLKKQPGVTDERIAELGLTDLASNPNVTREDVIAAVEQNRIPLRESVRRPYDEAAEYSDTISGIEDSLIYYRGGVKDVQAELERVRKMAPNSPLVKQYEDKLAVMRDKVDELEAKLDSTKPAKFGPDIDESYSLPGGEDYREIRVRLPERKSELPNLEGFTVETIRENKYTGQRDILIRNPQGNIVTNRYGFRGDDAQALQDEAESLARDATKKDNFYHRSHHDNEPNVLFHLRVANHVDEEGKRGLLIDELQSDWHQTGREKGYGPKFEDRYRAYYDTPTGQVNIGFGKTPEELDRMVKVSGWEGMPVEIKTEKTTAKIGQGVPEAPFKDNWYQLGLKRAIKEAVDTGMDRVYLTTGARQADRYDLSKKVEAITATKGSDQVHIQVALDGVNSKSLGNFPLEGNALDEAVGKELAEKIRAQSGIGSLHRKRYEGVDLKVGGEGMKQYYDKNYKNYLEKYAKQHGGKLGMTKIADGEPVYYIDITDAMRESAKKGQSYADGGGVFNTDPDITDAGRIIPEHTI